MSQTPLKTSLVAVGIVLLLAAVGWSIWANIQAETDASTSPASSSKNIPRAGTAAAVSASSATTASRQANSESGLAVISSPDAIVNKMTDKRLIMDHAAYGKNLAIAFILYANDNHGALPPDISSVRDKLGDDVKNYPFKIHPLGSLDKVKKPAQTVMLSEEPFMLSDGQWARNYVYADGHVESATSATGDFSTWESDHAPNLSNP